MSLPHLNSYNDPKLQKAYEMYVDAPVGANVSQGKVAKAAKVPLRTIQRRCSEDGWTGEREVRQQSVAVSSPPTPPNVAVSDPLPPLTSQVVDSTVEPRSVVMDRMLREWQDVVGHLRRWVVEEARTTFSAEKRPTIQQVMRLGTISERLATLDKKVHCVPDKMEVADTTPAATKHVQAVRDLMKQSKRSDSTEQAAAKTSVEAAALGPHGPM